MRTLIRSIYEKCVGHHQVAVGALLLFAVFAAGSPGYAQEKQRTTWKVAEANSTYTQRLNIEVGDVPGHVIRIYEIRRTFSDPAPEFGGVKATELWDRGQANYVDLNGPSWGYSVFLMSNGDKVFAKFNGAVKTAVDASGKKQTTYSGTTVLTGGTGKFKGIRGVFHEIDHVDIAAGISETRGDGEYWFEK